MYITKIEAIRNNKYRIYGDDSFLFALYGNELKKYTITQGAYIDDAIVQEICEGVIYKRARERALYLIEKRMFTVEKLKSKLRQNDYTEEIIDKVVCFLEKYGYLNDKEYVHAYIEAYRSRSSRKQIRFALLQQGVDKHLIDDCMDDCMDDMEFQDDTILNKQFQKYTKGKDLSDAKVRQKVFRYFYSKGFSSDLIEQLLRQNAD